MSYTLRHSRRVARHAERIARELGLSREDVARVRTAASVHDIGKVHTPRQILTKSGVLSAEELAVMQRHPVDGARMVAQMGDPEITSMVRHHHERLDGSGYPDGLRGDEIPLGSRIISVADTFDAITSARVYEGARKHRRALDVLSEEAGSRLDPDAVAAFLRYYSSKRTIAWSAVGLTGPPRLLTWIGGLGNAVGGSASPLAQGLAAIVAATLASTSLGGQPPPAIVASGTHPRQQVNLHPTALCAPPPLPPRADARGRRPGIASPRLSTNPEIGARQTRLATIRSPGPGRETEQAARLPWTPHRARPSSRRARTSRRCARRISRRPSCRCRRSTCRMWQRRLSTCRLSRCRFSRCRCPRCCPARRTWI